MTALMVPLENIEVQGGFNTRENMGEDNGSMEGLTASIKERGILQPVVVYASPKPGRYVLVAGHRRCHAAKKAGLTEVPVVVASSEQTRTLDSVLENMARLDLTVVERARAYRHLELEGWNMTRIAAIIGVYREVVSRRLRILKLPEPVLQLNIDRKLGEGHLIELMPLYDAGYPNEMITLMAQRAAREGFTSNAIRIAVNAHLEAAKAPPPGEAAPVLTPRPPTGPGGSKPRTHAVPPRVKGAALVQRVDYLRDALTRCAEAAGGMDSQRACREVRAICAEALTKIETVRP